MNVSLINNEIANCWNQAKIVPILNPNKLPTEQKVVPTNCTFLHTIESAREVDATGTIPNNCTHPLLSIATRLQIKTRHQYAPHGHYEDNSQLSVKLAYRTLLTIDISKAFDTVPRHLLIDEMLNTHIYDNVKNYFATNYVSGCQGITQYNSGSSTTRQHINEVP